MSSLLVTVSQLLKCHGARFSMNIAVHFKRRTRNRVISTHAAPSLLLVCRPGAAPRLLRVRGVAPAHPFPAAGRRPSDQAASLNGNRQQVCFRRFRLLSRRSSRTAYQTRNPSSGGGFKQRNMSITVIETTFRLLFYALIVYTGRSRGLGVRK